MVKLILSYSSDGLTLTRDTRGRTPLHLACTAGHKLAVLALVTVSGAQLKHSIYAADGALRTPWVISTTCWPSGPVCSHSPLLPPGRRLQCAIASVSIQTVQILLAAGCRCSRART